MIFWLDWKLFGNGYGMASPHCDDVFYWLKGRFYRWVGGFGAQLESYEWRAPMPQDRRNLFGHEFRPFSADRRLLRVRVAWCLTAGCLDADQLRQLYADLIKWRHGP